MNGSPARILAVTAGLLAGGALFGAVAGGIAITILMAVFGSFDRSLFLETARMSAVLGAVLLPIAGLLLLRRVPLWRALTGTLAGTVIGSLLGSALLGFLFYPFGVSVGAVLGAILGFFCATIGLRRRFPAVLEAERIMVSRGTGA